MNDIGWDEKLNIQTSGRAADHSDEHHFPYEATPYEVLVRLAESGYIRRDSKVIDYGCGKGRVGFFLNHELGCRVTGVEYNEPLYEQAMENLAAAKRGAGVWRASGKGYPTGVEFVCSSAEDFPVKGADRFYFFNPFSEEILNAVMEKIIESGYEEPRRMLLFFYYPSDEYLMYLLSQDELLFQDEIACQDLFPGFDVRERVLIFELDMTMWSDEGGEAR